MRHDKECRCDKEGDAIVASTGFKDYYSILGVAKSDDGDAIKKAFRQLARKYHPDVNPGDKSSEDKFKEINEAYEVLSDKDKRAKYDQYGQYWDKVGAPGSSPGGGGYRPQGGPQGGDFNDVEFGKFDNFDEFINDLLGRMGNSSGGGRGGGDPFSGGFRNPSTSNANLDIQAKVTLTFSEAFNGVQRPFSIGTETITVKIPPGAKTGSKIRVRGKGNFSPLYTSQRGDLYLIVELTKHGFFQFDGDNLTCEVAIAPDEAVLGTQVEVPTPDGTVTLTVPSGVKSGQSMRLRGKGWKNTKGDRTDQIVKLIITPPKDLSKIEREAYETLRDNRSTDVRSALKSVKL